MLSRVGSQIEEVCMWEGLFWGGDGVRGSPCNVCWQLAVLEEVICGRLEFFVSGSCACLSK